MLQTSASNLLVAIGKQYVKEVFDQLQKNFTAGQLPHIFVINTMAYLAEINRKFEFNKKNDQFFVSLMLTKFKMSSVRCCSESNGSVNFNAAHAWYGQNGNLQGRVCFRLVLSFDFNFKTFTNKTRH